MKNKLNVFAEIAKYDEEQRLVYGYASTEALDGQGERVAKAAIEEALPDYLKYGNIREMHSNSAVGVTEEASIDEKGLYVVAKVVDDTAWKKVKEGVYKGFSIGGKKVSKVQDTITKMKLTEISLVDRPANPEAVFDVFKAEDIEVEAEAQQIEDVPPNEDLKTGRTRRRRSNRRKRHVQYRLAG
jgi:phage head maturation protease